jgi:hypothetical protein
MELGSGLANSDSYAIALADPGREYEATKRAGSGEGGSPVMIPAFESNPPTHLFIYSLTTHSAAAPMPSFNVDTFRRIHLHTFYAFPSFIQLNALLYLLRLHDA